MMGPSQFNIRPSTDTPTARVSRVNFLLSQGYEYNRALNCGVWGESLGNKKTQRENMRSAEFPRFVLDDTPRWLRGLNFQHNSKNGLLGHEKAFSKTHLMSPEFVSDVDKSFRFAHQFKAFDFSVLGSHVDESLLEESLEPVMTLFSDESKRALVGRSRIEFIRDADKRLSLSGPFGTLRLCCSEQELDDFAKELAAQFKEWFISLYPFSGTSTFETKVSWFHEDTGEFFQRDDFGSSMSTSSGFFDAEYAFLRYDLGPFNSDVIHTICLYLGLSTNDLHHLLVRYGIEPFLNRLCCPIYLRKKLRSMKAMKTAEFYRRCGYVHNRGEKVIADQVLADRTRSRERNVNTLQNTVIYNTNDHDEWLTLYEAAGSSVSNPEIRRVEMMIRMKGMEEIAKENGHQGVFLTLTCPSRFHAYYATGQVNQNWLDADRPSVRDSHDWLQSMWRIAIRRANNAGIHPYGMRYSEPHHDGCEHWHCVVFVEPKQLRPFKKILREVFLQMDNPHEAGASRRRVKYKLCDPRKGSAVAYAAAYVAKNIDGHSMTSSTDESPLDGSEVVVSDNITDMVRRVDAWKSANRIRQFSPIGGPSISVWREFRRIRDSFDGNEMKYPAFQSLTTAEWFMLENIRLACDSGDFAQFVRAMGGIYVPAKDRPAKVLYRAPVAWQKAVADSVGDLMDVNQLESVRAYMKKSGLSRYGDMPAAQIMGLVFLNLEQSLRTKEWKTENKAFWLRSIGDQFHTMMDAGDYYAMAEKEYEAYQSLIDEALSTQENALVMQEQALLDFEEYERDYHDFQEYLWQRSCSSGGGFSPPLDLCQ